MWRIATSPRFRDTYSDIITHWTLRELQDAHLLLDEIDRAEAAHAAKREG